MSIATPEENLAVWWIGRVCSIHNVLEWLSKEL